MFSWLKRKSAEPIVEHTKNETLEVNDFIKSTFRQYSDDHLTKAAAAKKEAEAAVARGEYDVAWKHFHEQKMFYLKNASEGGFTPEQTLALDASVNEDLANILRLEGKHDLALAHIAYWIACSREKAPKREAQKLRAYFNRCSFKKTSFDECSALIERQRKAPDYRNIQETLLGWRSLES